MKNCVKTSYKKQKNIAGQVLKKNPKEKKEKFRATVRGQQIN